MKKITVIGSIILAVVVALICFIVIADNEGNSEGEKDTTAYESTALDDGETFRLSDYKEYTERYSSTRSLGAVNTADEAMVKAEELWRKVYGEFSAERKPYSVKYDAENEAWLVEGTLPNGNLGGVPHVIIEKTEGKILALWHDR